MCVFVVVSVVSAYVTYFSSYILCVIYFSPFFFFKKKKTVFIKTISQLFVGLALHFLSDCLCAVTKVDELSIKLANARIATDGARNWR